MSELRPLPILLLVNSNPERLSALSHLLTGQINYQIVTATKAAQAVDILKSKNVSFILSNINLDDFDGWRLARLVRSGVLKCAWDIPFIIVANTWCEHIANTTAKEFGINNLIPFAEKEKLLDIINKHNITPLADLEKSPLLIIEDNPDTQDLVRRILSSQFEIDIASDGESGLELWRQKKYSLVLLDVMLPGMSGNQILKVMMKENTSQSVVIMTANHTMELAEELMLAGAADFVTKPFRAQQLRRICGTASRREDFIISTLQFAAKVESLNQSRQEYRTIFEAHQLLLDQLGSVVIELKENGHISFLNKAWERLTGYSIDESHSKPLSDFVILQSNNNLHVSEEIDVILSGNVQAHNFEFRLKNKFGEKIWAEARLEITLAKDHKSRSISGTIENITEKKKAQQELEYIAMHDGLTGLFNRRYFETELAQFTATAQRGNGPHSLLYIDLDHFKIINDTLGHHQGDMVLKNIASLMKSRLRISDVLSRIGGDEFALLLPNTDRETATIIADDICNLLDEYRCQISDQVFKVNCSIGISEINGKEASAEEHMKQADIALYAAKKQGRNLSHVYDVNDTQSKDLQASMEWAQQIQQAVADDKLVLFFQPVVEIRSGKTAYFEALVRLLTDGRIVSPGEFIPALEREGGMALLDRQVINKAFKYLADYPQLNKISINLSAQGFGDERLVPFISEKLSLHKVDANKIIFELTESASLSNITETQKIVSGIRKHGCEFSIDDFGTGFSTFNYLKQLPAESVKIDGSFVVDLATNPVDLALVKAIYEVATALGKSTVAEFVENKETLQILSELGVTFAQGYYLGKPKPVEEIFS